MFFSFRKFLASVLGQDQAISLLILANIVNPTIYRRQTYMDRSVEININTYICTYISTYRIRS